MMRAIYYLLLGLLLALLGQEIIAGDGYRVFWLSVTIVCLLCIRKDFTEGGLR